MTNKNNIYHVISNTHWDREWRFPFQRNRQMLVDMIDQVLDILEKNPDYRAFHLDSQSIVLKDYLEIKPHNKERIIKLTKENRLLHGPWYILPEEFQVGGENLIRNLLIGHKVSKLHGGVSKMGYSPFSWGQISQLPQIYKQFNIDLIMFYRGINSEDSPKAEFLWEGADKTEMVSSRFSTMPRYNFYFYIYRQAVHNQGFFDIEQKWGGPAIPFHFADKNQEDEDYFIISPHQQYYPETLKEQVTKIINDQADDFTTPHKIWMEGHDSSGPNAQTVDIIKDIREQMPDVNVVHSTLEEYAKALEESVDKKELKRVTGERRSAQNNNRCGNLFGYTTSARMYLKQANFDAERWIQYYAEPFNVFSGVFGRDINDQYPETAWELIVQNSAHDSIGGCSLDRIHEDMMMRYKHAVEISKGVFDRSVKHLLNQLDTSGFASAKDIPAEERIFVTVINPLNFYRSEVVEAYIDVPADLDKGNIEVFSAKGEQLECEIMERTEHQPILEQMINRPMHFNMVRYKTNIYFTEIPTFSLTAFHVYPVEKAAPKAELSNDLILENEFLKVEANSDGSLNITDKKRNKTYQNTASFADEGDAGHAWVFEKTGETFSTLNTKAEIVRSLASLLYNELTIKHKLALPVNLDERKNGGKNTATLTITLKVGLKKDSKFMSFNVEVDNQSESHRLRMLFPSELAAEHSYGEGQFDVVERTLERPETTDWIEQPMYDFPMHHFVDLTDGLNGMALLVDGLKEYEVLPDDNKTLAITLFRTFEYKINPAAPQNYSYEKGAQMLGKSNYRLGFYPHAGNWNTGQVFKQAMKFNYDLRLAETGSLSGKHPAQLHLLKVDPVNIVVNSIKKTEDGDLNSFIVRLYNPTKQRLAGMVDFVTGIKEVKEVNLEEIELKPVEKTDNNRFAVNIEPKKIKTYRITI